MAIGAPARGIIGAPIDRIEGPLKVTGAAKYAYEYPLERVTYGFLVQSVIAKGRIVSIDAEPARAMHGVLAIVTHENAPKLGETSGMMRMLQTAAISFHGEAVAIVVAETFEIAREAAARVVVRYEDEPHDVELRVGHPKLYTPQQLVVGETDTFAGDADAVFAASSVKLDETYTTPHQHNNPLEPHATIAVWENGGLTLYDTNQGAHWTRDAVAKAFGLDPALVRVIATYVGGGFGSKGMPRPHGVLAAMGAKAVGRPVKVALTRQQMFALTGYRTPTIQRIRIGAKSDGTILSIAHDVVEQASTVEEFVEPTAVATRTMYSGEARRTTHLVAKLDLPIPSYMRAPGEAAGMFALESAIDELAIRCNADPIDVRLRNEPEVDPEKKLPFSTRNLVACLRQGAQRFGWEGRSPKPGTRRSGRKLIGHGVAAATYPARRMPSSAMARVDADGSYRVTIGAADMGTGALTILTQIAAETLGVAIDRVTLLLGDSAFPPAFGGVGSMGTSSWGTAVFEASRKLRALIDEHAGEIPPEGLEVRADTGMNPDMQAFAMHAYGAQFAEVHVDVDSGEVHVPRLVGVFACGKIMNAKTARSQLIGGMSWGIGFALQEETVVDPRFGHFVNHDLAEYHVVTNADIGEIDASWIEEDDQHVNPMGAKGIGEIGIVGTAAAIANAVYDATGIRVRDLPIRPGKLVTQLSA